MDQAPMRRWGWWLAIAVAWVVSVLSGFSIGRFISLVPLVLTAYVAGRHRGDAFLSAAIVLALAVWIVFSFALYGVLPLLSGFGIEALACLVALMLSEVLPPPGGNA